jgi:hypothetical protein
MFEYRAGAVETDEGHRRDLLNQNSRESGTISISVAVARLEGVIKGASVEVERPTLGCGER